MSCSPGLALHLQPRPHNSCALFKCRAVPATGERQRVPTQPRVLESKFEKEGRDSPSRYGIECASARSFRVGQSEIVRMHPPSRRIGNADMQDDGSAKSRRSTLLRLNLRSFKPSQYEQRRPGRREEDRRHAKPDKDDGGREGGESAGADHGSRGEAEREPKRHVRCSVHFAPLAVRARSARRARLSEGGSVLCASKRVFPPCRHAGRPAKRFPQQLTELGQSRSRRPHQWGGAPRSRDSLCYALPLPL